MISLFRDQLRTLAFESLHSKAEINPTILLSLCDRLRNDYCPELGIILEDRVTEGSISLPALVKIIDQETLVKLKEEKEKVYSIIPIFRLLYLLLRRKWNLLLFKSKGKQKGNQKQLLILLKCSKIFLCILYLMTRYVQQ